METRNYEFGSLRVQLWKHEQYGWFTTTQMLARGCGVSDSTLQRIIGRYDLVQQGLIFIETELAANLHLITSRGPKPKQFWTIKGMQFAATLLRTEICIQFRSQVLGTIETLETNGLKSMEAVIARLLKVEKLCEEVLRENQELKAQLARREQKQYAHDTLDATHSKGRLAGRHWEVNLH